VGIGIVFECNVTGGPVASGDVGVVAVRTPMVDVRRSERRMVSFILVLHWEVNR